MSSLLDDISNIRFKMEDLERAKRAIILEQKALESRLDTAIVAAVDWGNESPKQVAEMAGYKSHAAVRDARRRLEARRETVG